MDNGLQLEMNFGSPGGNRFHENLDNGTFMMLVEVNTPGRDLDINAAHDKLRDIEFAVSKSARIPTGIAFTDKYGSKECWNVADYAAGLESKHRDMHLIYLSGKDTSLENMVESIRLADSHGFRNIVPVSGDHVRGENFKQTRRRQFVESAHVLKMLGGLEDCHMWAGCGVNPYKYTPGDAYPQMFKLIKKLRLGAGFVVTNFGWDMLKLQELRWYLNGRGRHYPLIARLMLLTPERVEKILRGEFPGTHISRDFKALLENELRYSYSQFEAAQWRRLQIQAAGCRFLGYSGLQVAGLDTPDKIRIAGTRIADALEEFVDFEDWKKEYFSHFAKLEMAPYPNCFYIFEGLFSQAYPDSTPKMTNSGLPKCKTGEKLVYKLRKFLFPHSNRQNAGEHFIAKKVFAGCRECSYCRLPLTQYVCPETCPKGLANGPCGGSKADGKCECGEIECIHAAKLRLAAWRREIHQLEKEYIEPAVRKLN